MPALHPKVADAVALISERLKKLDVQTLNELHDWWVKELQREPAHLKDAIRWMIENRLAVAKTAGSTKLLRLAGDKELEHKPSGYGKARLISEASLLAYFAARTAHRDVPIYTIAEEKPRPDEITIPEAARIIKKAKPTVQQRATKLGLERRMWRGAWLYNRRALLGAFCIQEVPTATAIGTVAPAEVADARFDGGKVVPLRSVAGGGDAPEAKKLVDTVLEKVSGQLGVALGDRLARLFYRLMNEELAPGKLWDCIEQLSSPEYDAPPGDPVGEKMMELALQLAVRVLKPLTKDS